MKHLHFFGCSFTAGDELSDDVWFPWKHECNSPEEYYSRRSLYLGLPGKNLQYQTENKKKAYPARLQSDEYKIYNHSSNGESLRTCIFRVLQIIFSSGVSVFIDNLNNLKFEIKNHNIPIDAIFVQIPPPGREFYVTKNGRPTSIQLATMENTVEPIKTYLKSKLNSHSTEQPSIEELMDMIMLSNLAKQKNIPLYFIEFNKDTSLRMKDIIHQDFDFLKTDFCKEVNLITFTEIVYKAWHEDRILLGRHLDVKAHQEMADQLKNLLPNILKQ